MAGGLGGNAVRMAWAEYEARRRIHFAMELLLSVIVDAVAQAPLSLAEVADVLLSEPIGLPPILTEGWPRAGDARTATAVEAAESVPENCWCDAIIPEKLSARPPYHRALGAVCLLCATAWQSSGLRQAGIFPDRNTPGDRALSWVLNAGNQPFAQWLAEILEIVASAHLHTTYGKMARRQQCSLRFFPDGPRLWKTGIAFEAGHSAPRLDNVVVVLRDAGIPLFVGVP